MPTRRREFLAFGGNAPPPASEGYWSAPDPMLVDAGASGEFLVARVRLVLVSLVTLIPIYNIIFMLYLIEAWIGLASSLGALVFAVLMWAVVRRGFYRPWLGFLTSAVDVSFVTATLVAFLGPPLRATPPPSQCPRSRR